MTTEFDQYQANLQQIQTTMLYGQANRIPLLKRILLALDQPDLKYPIIHVCGTNGKGSTSLMMSQLLQATGLKVGVFSSPALNDPREMIQVDRQFIEYRFFNQAFDQLAAGMGRLGMNWAEISEFEAWFLISVLYFAQAKVDIAILECGLGGELDATNAIATAAYDVFVHIDYDHMALLGDTIEAIATTKAKIIRAHAQVINYPDQFPIVNAIIETIARERAAHYHSAKLQNVLLTKGNLDGSDVLAKFNGSDLKLHLSLAGSFQVENLRTVLAFVESYNRQPIQGPITAEILQQTLKDLRFAGRMQLISQDPLLYGDGGHNPDAFASIVRALKPYEKDYQLILVLGFLKDKDVLDNLDLLADLKADYIATTPDNPKRALDADTLRELMQKALPAANTITAVADPANALEYAKVLAQHLVKPLIFVAGSFYLVKTVVNPGE